MRDLISTLKKKKKKSAGGGNDLSNILQNSSHVREKSPSRERVSSLCAADSLMRDDQQDQDLQTTVKRHS